MSGKIKYTDESLGKVEVIRDFLPSPEELAFKEDTVKITIALSKSSVEFFKREAEKHDTKYQLSSDTQSCALRRHPVLRSSR
jgi:hypothetical protein